MHLDDFARKTLRKIDRVDLPAAGTQVRRGEVLFVVRRGEQVLRLRSPLSGEVARVNPALQREATLLLQSPYDRGWVCVLRPTDLAAELPGLRIGKPVIRWYQDEVQRLRKTYPSDNGMGGPWPDMEEKFFGPGIATMERVTETTPAG